jgi:dipeptidase D
MNLDSEDEGELYIGCAGGTNANAIFTLYRSSCRSRCTAYKLSVTGLKGGHSGVDIHLGRGNSNKVLFRFLWHAAKKHGLRLSSVDGGSLRNAIPRESFAIITIPNDMKDDFLKCVPGFTETDPERIIRSGTRSENGCGSCRYSKKHDG